MTIENTLIKAFNTFGSAYQSMHRTRMPRMHRKAFADIAACRTIAHGMIQEVCEGCGECHNIFGACRNRACPRCNCLRNHEWIRTLCEKYPNVNYYHIVFTVPEELRYLARRNQKSFYTILLDSVNKTLRAFSSRSTWMQGEPGYMSVLHTWDSRMNIHPHVHVLFMGGYVGKDGVFVPLSESKVFPNEAMSCRFKTIMLKALRTEFSENIPSDIWKLKWIVYTKKAETGDSHVIEYLGSYVKRTAIAASRIIEVGKETVTFKYRHHMDRHTIEMRDMTVSGLEFIRRYMQHVLPSRFVRVRYYGLMHASKAETISEIKARTGCVQMSERYGGKYTNHCEKCKKPFFVTMVIFSMYAFKNKGLQVKTEGKFYNTKIMPIDNRPCNPALHLTVETS
jgi:Putative transposase/Transposase zinc-binding domain